MSAFPQTGPYIPRSNGGFADWITAISQGIASNPALYMSAPAEAAVLVAKAREFIAAHALTTAAGTRTKVTIAERDAIRRVITPFFAGVAQRIKLNNGVSDGDKIAIGVRPRNTSRQKRNVPTSSPMVMVIGATAGCHTLRFHDSFTPDSPAKPFGAVCLQLFMDVTDGSREASVEQARFIDSPTKNPIGVSHDPKNAGKTATYWGRWANRRGDVGPWSTPVSFTIAWGAAVASSTRKASAPGGDDQSLKIAA